MNPRAHLKQKEEEVGVAAAAIDAVRAKRRLQRALVHDAVPALASDHAEERDERLEKGAEIAIGGQVLPGPRRAVELNKTVPNKRIEVWKRTSRKIE